MVKEVYGANYVKYLILEININANEKEISHLNSKTLLMQSKHPACYLLPKVEKETLEQPWSKVILQIFNMYVLASYLIRTSTMKYNISYTPALSNSGMLKK